MNKINLKEIFIYSKVFKENYKLLIIDYNQKLNII